MPSTTVAWGTFPSRKAADQAVQRLISSGFARNSIDLKRHDYDEGWNLMVHTREDNQSRAEHLIRQSAPMYTLERAATGTVQSAKAHPILLLGVGVVAGLAIYNLLPHGNRRPTERSRRSGRR